MPENELDVRATVTAWPVGQGLFTSADFRVRGHDQSFRLVYDCGAGRDQAHLQTQLGEFGRSKSGEFGKPPLHLLVVSHFHFDHISGIRRLLAIDSPRLVWVSYLAPAVATLSAVFVAAAGHEAGLDPDEIEWLVRFTLDPPSAFGGGGETPVVQIGGPVPHSHQGNGRDPDHGSLTPELDLFQDGGMISYRSEVRWETVPVVELLTWVRKPDPGLAKDAWTRLSQLPIDLTQDHLCALKEGKLSPPQANEVATLIVDAAKNEEKRKEIRKAYRAFDASLNNTSLFLMARAIDSDHSTRLASVLPEACLHFPACIPPHCPVSKCPVCGGGAILWCGDAEKELLECLVDAGPKTFRALLFDTCLWQVPHHGAKSSLCSEFYHCLGWPHAFVSFGERNTFHHPNGAVLRETMAVPVTDQTQRLAYRIHWH